MSGALVLLSAGCAHYRPEPIDTTARLQTRTNRTLDVAALNSVIGRIAPRAAPAGPKLDRLSLFAALVASDPRVEAARAGVATAQAQARASRRAPGPVLTLSSEYANDPATRSSWLLGAALDVPIDAGGRRAARLTAADIQVSLARIALVETIWTERMAARRALVDRMIAQRRRETAALLATLQHRQLVAMERRLAAGAIARPDVVRVRLAEAETGRMMADADTRYAQAGRSIAAMLGLPEDGLAAFDLDWAGFDAPVGDPLAGVPADARGPAITARAGIAKALANYDLAEAELRGEVARQYPAITISPGYIWERGLVKLPLSIGLALPPLDLNSAAIAAALARRTEAGKQVEAQIAQAALALDHAIAERQRASAELDAIRNVQLPGAQRLAAQAEAELRQGGIDRTEWAVAQIAMLQYRLSELDALARVQAADADLEDALQRPLEGPELMIEHINGIAP